MDVKHKDKNILLYNSQYLLNVSLLSISYIEHKISSLLENINNKCFSIYKLKKS